MAADAVTAAKLWELTRLTRSLATTLDYDRVLEQVVTSARGLLETDAAAVLIESGDGVARVAATVGVDSGRARGFAAPLDERVGQALTSLLAHEPGDRIVMAPLVDHRGIRGVLAVRRTAGASPVPQEEALLSALADHAVLALVNTKRLRGLETDAERAAATQRLLARAGLTLAASLDYDTTLASVTRLVVPELADWCLVDLIEPDGSLRRVAVAQADPGQGDLARELSRHPPDPKARHLGPEALRSGKARLYAELPDAQVEGITREAEHLALPQQMAPRSFIAAPLAARGRTLGVLTFVRSRPGACYGPADLALAEALGRRVALAVDNARLYHEAQAAVRAREDFLFRASYELRTPLTLVVGTVRLLARATAGQLSERSKELLDIALRNVDIMMVLIKKFLDASKLPQSPRADAFEPLALARIVGRTIDLVQAHADEKGVVLRVAVPASLGVHGDAVELEHLLRNLLANAIQSTPAGGEVVVDAEAFEDRAAVVRVRDTGAGIPPEHLSAIFEPFFQAGAREAEPLQGAAQRLAVCRQIVALHGGTIWAESEGPGRGSTVVVSLPAARAGSRAA